MSNMMDQMDEAYRTTHPWDVNKWISCAGQIGHESPTWDVLEYYSAWYNDAMRQLTLGAAVEQRIGHPMQLQPFWDDWYLAPKSHVV